MTLWDYVDKHPWWSALWIVFGLAAVELVTDAAVAIWRRR